MPIALVRAGLSLFRASATRGTAAMKRKRNVAGLTSSSFSPTGRAGERAQAVRLVRKTGDWVEARRILGPDAPARVARAMRMSLRAEGRLWKDALVNGVRSQAPGGAPFKEPLAESTLAWRKLHGFRGKKALMRTGDMVRSIKMKSRRDFVFVGILNSERSRMGRSMVRIAMVQEKGDVIVLSGESAAAARRFLFHMAHKTGGRTKPAGGGGSGGVIIITIPARPFFKPVHDMLTRSPGAIRKRFLGRVALILRGDFGIIAGGGGFGPKSFSGRGK